MKKNKQKLIVKESRKLAKKEINTQIVDALTTIVTKFGKTSKKADKVIGKSAKLISKRLANLVNLNPITEEAGTNEPTPAPAVKKSPIKKITKKVIVKQEDKSE